MEKKLSYTLKRSNRAKRMRVAVYCDGNVVITSPANTEVSVIEKFIAEKMQWILAKIKYFGGIDRRALRTFSHEDYVENKEKALVLVAERVEVFNKVFGFSFNQICIKNQKTRWGSCSRKKNINVNYKVIFLPQAQQDYIIVHEMCHLKEFNHSKKFWALVQRVFPDYLEIKKELRNRELFYR